MSDAFPRRSVYIIRLWFDLNRYSRCWRYLRSWWKCWIRNIRRGENWRWRYYAKIVLTRFEEWISIEWKCENSVFWQKLIIRLRLSIRPRVDCRRGIFLEGFPQGSVRFHDLSDSHQLSEVTLLPADSPVSERTSRFGRLFVRSSLDAFFSDRRPALSKLVKHNPFGEVFRPLFFVVRSFLSDSQPHPGTTDLIFVN